MEKLGNITMLNTEDVRKVLKIGKRKCLDLFHSKEFPSIQIGKTLLVKEDSFNDFLSKKRYI